MFNDVTADMEANKKLSSIVTELSLKERNPKISIFFMSQSYFKVPTDTRLRNTLFYHENN